MSALFPNDWRVYLSVLAVFLRLLGLFILVPGFSHQTIPSSVKLLLALVISLAIYPVVRHAVPPVPLHIGGMAVYALRESLIGFLMGFVAYLTFEAIHLAAHFMGYQMGFGAASLFDPVTQASVSVLVPLAGWLALMVFLFMDMHHYLLSLFVQSFDVTRGADFARLTGKGVITLLTDGTSRLFVIAIKIAAPFTFLVLASNVATGILSRLLPQMQMVLFVFPVTIFLGVCSLYLFAPEMLEYFEELMDQMGQDLVLLLRTI